MCLNLLADCYIMGSRRLLYPQVGDHRWLASGAERLANARLQGLI